MTASAHATSVKPTPFDPFEYMEEARSLDAEGKGADAARLYRRLARAGHVPAAKRLVEVYEKGIPGVPVDRFESVKWNDVAKRLEESNRVQYERARVLQREGKGADSVRRYEESARGGHGRAARRLGDIYAKGISGVPANSVESAKWYDAARRLGEKIPTPK